MVLNMALPGLYNGGAKKGPFSGPGAIESIKQIRTVSPAIRVDPIVSSKGEVIEQSNTSFSTRDCACNKGTGDWVLIFRKERQLSPPD